MTALSENRHLDDVKIRRDRLWVFVQLPLAGAIVAGVATVVSWAPRLPAEVANQWSAGDVTTVRPLAVTVASVAVPAVATWLLLALARVTSESIKFGHRSTVGALAGLTLVLAGALPLLVAPSLATSDPWSAPDPGLLPLVTLGAFGLLVAVAVAFALGARRPRARVTSADDASVDHRTRTASGAPLSDRSVARRSRTIGLLSTVVACLGIVVLAATTVAPWPLALVAGAAAAPAMRALRRPPRR